MNLLHILKNGTINFDADQIKVNVENVLIGLGMKFTDADEYLLNLIEELKIKCLKLAQPKAGFTFLEHPNFNLETKQLEVNGKTLHLGKTITSMLKKSEIVIVFASTIGFEVEWFSKSEMSIGNSLEGYIIDLLGSEMTEATTEILHNYLQKIVEQEGLGLTNRYSPGYCNWPVSDQHKLFSILADDACGITLNNSSLMSPVKSVSGILGVGKGLKKVDYKCRLCSDEKCILRRQF